MFVLAESISSNLGAPTAGRGSERPVMDDCGTQVPRPGLDIHTRMAPDDLQGPSTYPLFSKEGGLFGLKNKQPKVILGALFFQEL